MPYEKFKLTEEERALIEDAYQRGAFDLPGEWERFQQRVKNDTQREGIIERALTTPRGWGGAGYEARAIGHAFSNPEIIADTTVKFFEEHGIAGGLKEIGKQAITSPFRIAAQAASGQPSDTPIQDLFDVASLGTIFLGGSAVAGSVLRATGMRSISAGTRKAVLNAAGKAGYDAARAARVAGSSADDAFRAGMKAAQQAVYETASPRASNLLRMGEGIGRVTSNRGLRAGVRGIEAGSIIAAGEEAGLEAIGEGMFDVGTTLANRAFTPFRDRIARGLMGEDPPPDWGGVPPTDTTTQKAIPQEQVIDAEVVEEQQQEATSQEATSLDISPQIIEDLFQDNQGNVVAPNTKGAKQTLNGVRKYAYGDPKVPNSIGVVHVNRKDNKNWAVWFEGGTIEGVNEGSPITFDAEDNINSYADARDAAFAQATGRAEKRQKTEDKEDTERAEAREQREQKYQPEQEQETDLAGLDADIATEVLQTLEQNPEADPRALLNNVFDTLIKQGTINETDAYELRSQVEQIIETALAEQEQVPVQADVEQQEAQTEEVQVDEPEQTDTGTAETIPAEETETETTPADVQEAVTQEETPTEEIPEPEQVPADETTEPTPQPLTAADEAAAEEGLAYVIDQGYSPYDAAVEALQRYDGQGNVSYIPTEAEAERVAARIEELMEESANANDASAPEWAEQIVRRMVDDTDDFVDGLIKKQQERLKEYRERGDRLADNRSISESAKGALDTLFELSEIGGLISESEKANIRRVLDEKLNKMTGGTTPAEETTAEPTQERPSFRDMTASEMHNYLTTQEVKYRGKSRDGKVRNFTIGPEVDGDVASISITEPSDGIATADIWVVEDNFEIIARRNLTKRTQVNKVDVRTARNVLSTLTVEEVLDALRQGESTGNMAWRGDVEQKQTISEEATPQTQLESTLLDILRNDGTIESNKAFFKLADEAFGGRDNYSPKEAYDILDVAVSKFIVEKGLTNVNVTAEEAKEIVRQIKAIEDKLPTQSVQDRQQRQNQQYNTPYSYAYAINWIANLQDTDIVLEPSAGTGNIAVYAEQNAAAVHVNEISERRVKMLEQMGFENITKEDASGDLNSYASMRDLSPTVVVMNPPFSATGGMKSNKLAGNMINAAFDTLQPGGRLVAIVGGGMRKTDTDNGMSTTSTGYRKFFAGMSQKAHIRADVPVSGKIYTKFGTNYHTRVLVFDKPVGDEQVPDLPDIDPVFFVKNTETIEQLIDRMEEVRDARTVERPGTPISESRETPDSADTEQRPDVEQRSEPSVEDDRGDTTELDATQPPVSDVGGGESETAAERQLTDGDARVGDADESQASDDISTEEQPPGDRTDEGSGDSRDGSLVDDEAGSETVEGRGLEPTDRPEPTPAERPSGRSGDDVRPVDIKAEHVRVKEEHLTPLVESGALAAVESPDVSNLPLQLPQKMLNTISEAQEKGIKLAIRATDNNIKLYYTYFDGTEFVEGQQEYKGGFLFGDDTGVGKTIQGLGFLMNEILNNGNKKHLFISEKSDLYTQLQEDLQVIGGDAKHIFDATQQGVEETIKRTEGIAFSTYTMLRQKAAQGKGQGDRLGQMLEYLIGVRPPLSLTSPTSVTDSGMSVNLPNFDNLVLEYDMLSKDEKAGFEAKYGETIFSYMRQYGGANHNKQLSIRKKYEDLQEAQKEQGKVDTKTGAVSSEKFLEAAKNFTGTIIFDESHKMRNDTTATAIMGRKLQRFLPNAKVIYMSATPVTRIDEMRYAERLGLWGPGTPFKTHNDFSEEMKRGGFATKEIVAKDMKALGVYIRRQLDYSGVSTDMIMHNMTKAQEEIYNAAPELWRIVRANIGVYMERVKEMAKEAGNGASESAYTLAGKIMQQFWARNQMFYNAMLDSFKMASVLPHMKQKLDAGEKVVIQFVNTYGESQKRQMARGAKDGIPLDQRQFTPLEILYDYIENSFPVEEKTIKYNSATGQNEVVARKDADGNVVINKKALEQRNLLLDQMKKISAVNFAVDIFHQKMYEWGYASVELSGRPYYFVRDKSGKRLTIKNPKSLREKNKEKYLKDEVKALAFSKVAGTGYNLPALTKGVPVNHYVIQSGWNIVDMLQGLGRTMRAKRAEDPRYFLTSVDLPASMRMAGAIIDKLADIGAAVTGQAKSSLGSRLAAKELEDADAETEKDQENQNYILSAYGEDALFNLYRSMNSGNVIKAEDGTDIDFRRMLTLSGMNDGRDDTGQVSKEEMPEVRQFLNRLANMQTQYQRPLGMAFLNQLDGVIAAAIADDSLDKGADVIDVESANISKQIVINTHESGIESYLTEVEYTENLKRNTWDWLMSVIHKDQGFEGVAGRFMGFYRNKRSGMLWAIFEGPVDTDERGHTVVKLQRFNTRGNASYILAEDVTQGGDDAKYESVGPGGYSLPDRETHPAKEEWEAKDASLPQTRSENITMVTGALLPVWRHITPDVSDVRDLERLGMTVDEFTASQKVKRIALDDGTVLQGRTVPTAYIKTLLGKFGIDSPEFGVKRENLQNLTAKELFREQLLDTYNELTLDNGWVLKRRERAGESRIQIIGDNLPSLDQRDGIVSEWTPAAGFQYLIQSDDAGEAAFKQLITEFPARTLTIGTGAEARTVPVEVIDLDVDERTAPPESRPTTPPDDPDDGGSPPANDGGVSGGTTPPIEPEPEQMSEPEQTPEQTPEPEPEQTPEPEPEQTPEPEPEPTEEQRAEAEQITNRQINDRLESPDGLLPTEDEQIEMLAENERNLVIAQSQVPNQPLTIRNMGRGGNRSFKLPTGTDANAVKEARAALEPDLDIESAESILNYIQNAPVSGAMPGADNNLDFAIGNFVWVRVKAPSGGLQNLSSGFIYIHLNRAFDKPLEKYLRRSHISPRKFVISAIESLTLEDIQEAMKKEDTETTPPDSTPGSTPPATPTSKYELEAIKFDVSMSSGENVNVDAYRIKDHGISYIDLILHKAINPATGMEKFSTWVVADGETGTYVYESESDNIDAIIEIAIQRVEAAGEEVIKSSRAAVQRATAEETEVLRGVRNVENWTRRGKKGEWDYKEGGEAIIIGKSKITVEFTGIPGLKSPTTKQDYSSKSMKQLFERSIRRLSVKDLDRSESTTEPEKTTEPEPEPTDTTKEAMDTVEEQIEESVGDSADVKRSSSPGMESIVITPNRESTPTEETSDFTYHGATFQEDGNTLSIEGDAIPESFWDYWHSGGRGRNSAHKKAMKDAGWKYSWTGGSKNRIYQFSITKSDLAKWKAAHPDDGSEAQEYVESGTPEQMALIKRMREAEIEYVPAVYSAVGKEYDAHFNIVDDITARPRRAYNRTSRMNDAKAFEVSFYGRTTLKPIEQRVEFREIGATGSYDNVESETRAAVEKALEKLDASDLEFPDPEPTEAEIAAKKEAEAAKQVPIKAGILKALQNGEYTRDGHRDFIVNVDGVEVKFHLMSWTTTGLGSEKTRTTQISVSPKYIEGQTPAFSHFNVEVPNEIIQKYNDIFDDEVLADIRNPANWTRDGRKNAFIYDKGGSVAIKKDGNFGYTATFTGLANSTVKAYYLEGDTLQARLESALTKITAHDFTHHEVEIIKDTLSETQQESPVSEKPDNLGTHLEALDIDSADWGINDTQGQRLLLESAYDKLAGDLTPEQTHAYNRLKNHLNAVEGTPTPVGGGAPLVQTLETIRDFPEDIPQPELSKSRSVRFLAGTRLRRAADGIIPKAKYWIENSRRAYMAGMTNLQKMGPLGESILDAMEYMMSTMDRFAAVELNRIQAPLEKFHKLVKSRRQEGEKINVTATDLSDEMWRFVENNKAIEDDAELSEIAEEFKPLWKQTVLNITMAMLQMRREVSTLDGDEKVVIRSGSNNQFVREWTPVIYGYGDEIRWDGDVPTIQHKYQTRVGKDGKEYRKDIRDQDVWVPVEQAILNNTHVWMPHIFPETYWDGILHKFEVEGIIGKLNAAAKRKGVKIPGFEYDSGTDTWTFIRTDDTFTDKQEAVDFAKEYWREQVSLARDMLSLEEKGQSLIGRYGNLELERETRDNLYMRDIPMLTDVIEHSARRIGEISVWGQYDPILGEWPRLAKYIAAIENTPLNPREAALMVVSRIMMAHESGMFERLKNFRQGEQVAASVASYWNTPDIQKLIDDNPDDMTDEVINTLVNIGMIEKGADNRYKLVGKSRNAMLSTFIRHFVPHAMTIAMRENTVMNIVRGIGHHEPTESLQKHTSKVVTALNHLTTMMTLGFGTSAQNLVEIPLLATMAGSKNMTAGIARTATDKDFQEMLPKLGASASWAVAFLMDTKLQSEYMKYIGFKMTEETSRLVGAGVGWIASVDAINKYIADPSETNQRRITELGMEVEPIENYRVVFSAGHAPALNDLVSEAETRIREGYLSINGLVRPNTPAPSNGHVDIVGNQIANGARHISKTVLKPYSALSMPHLLTRRDPLIRLGFKFMSWPAQMHRFIWSQFNHARREVRQGNFGPAWRLAQGLVLFGFSTAMLGTFFAALAGRDDDERNNMVLAAIAEGHLLGVGSMMLQMSLYADGNPYKAQNLIKSILGSPTAGVVGRMGANIITGKPVEAAGDIFWQMPGARDVRRFGGFATKGE